MKKIRYILGFIFVALILGLVSCANQINDSSEGGAFRGTATTPQTPPATIPEGHIRVHFKDPQHKAKDFWLWGDVDEEFWKNGAWGDKAFDKLYQETGFTVADIKPKEGGTEIKFIPRSEPGKDEAKLTGDVTFYLTEAAATKGGASCFFTTEAGKNEVWVNSKGVVVDSQSKLAALVKAEIVSIDGNEIDAVVADLPDSVTSIATADVTVKSSDGATTFTVSGATLKGDEIEITLSNGDISKAPYKVTYNSTTVSATAGAALIDNEYSLDDPDFEALQMNKDPAASLKFTTWAPTADSVKLQLFATAADVDGTPGKTEDMTKVMNSDTPPKWTGKWECTVDATSYKYYKYQIKTKLGTNSVANIWSFAASPDSKASELVNISTNAAAKPASWEASYTNPFGNSGTDTKKYSDAIIYEMHVSDWSGCTASDPHGSFEGLTSDENIAHLKDLGVTHVQILPMFDYAQTNSDPGYNWGYNPYHYNVPEGRYTKNMTDGTDSVKQMRAMIKKLHDAGIAVIMDVVYNHTSGTKTGSLYDMTVPEYFYRLDDSGNYSNGSGCGNEIATNHDTVALYVILSLKHWMEDYHINGFRFDLMGLHEEGFIADVVGALKSIDKNVLVYGEPWTGGTSTVEDGIGKANVKGGGWAAFDDDFRDAIKGGVFKRIEKGLIQGDLGTGEGGVVNNWRETKILKNLKGESDARNPSDSGNFDPQFTLHYTEAHDNSTLFDKLVLSHTRTTDTAHAAHVGDLFAELSSATIAGKPASFTTNIDYIKAQDKLAAAFVILAQGMPFLNGGQEFLRSKMGNDNSYGGEASVSTETYLKENKISLQQKTKYFDVYKTYRGLIALRKAYPGCFGNNEGKSGATISTAVVNDSSSQPIHGFIKYSVGDGTNSFVIYYNTTNSAQTISEAGNVVDVEGRATFKGLGGAGFGAPNSVSEKYTIASASTTVTSVGPKSFVIIKK